MALLGMPIRVTGVYWANWHAETAITALPTSYNTIILFVAESNTTTGAMTWPGPTPPPGIDTCRARGQRILLSCGGAGLAVDFNTRAKSDAFIASIKQINVNFGGTQANPKIDGVDFNTFEGTTVSRNVTEYTYMAQSLKAYFGSAFICTAPPAPWYSGDKTFCAAMLASGAWNYVSPQFYGGTGNADVTNITTKIDQWVTDVGAGDASKIMPTFGIDPSGTDYSTTAQCQTAWNTIEAAHPTIRGANLWVHYTDAAQSYSYASTVNPLVLSVPGGTVAKIGTLVETFTSALGATWTQPTEGSIVSGQYQIVGPVGGAELRTTAATWDLTSSAVSVQLVSRTAGTSQDVLGLSGADGSGGYYFSINASNNLVMQSRAAGAFDESGAPFVTYSTTNHRWLRIRHTGTQVLFEASPDGVNWPTALRTVTPNTTNATTMILRFKSTSGTLIFDNVNNLPAASGNAKVSTLVETFTSALSGSVWTQPSEGSIVSGQYQIASALAAPAMAYLYTNFVYDLTNSSAMVQVVSRTTSQTYDPLALTGITGAGGYVFVITPTNVMEMQVRDAGAFDDTGKTTVTYDTVNHKWLRIRHNGTQVLFEGSPDSNTWTTLRTVTTLSTQDPTALQVRMGAQGGTLVLDNLNSPVAAGNPKAGALVETFSGALSTTTWDEPVGGAISGGSYTITSPSARVALTTDGLYDIVSSQLLCQVVTAVGSTTNNITEMSLRQADGTGGYSIIKNAAGNLVFSVYPAGSTTDATPTTITYNAAQHAWWRIRHDGTTMQFETLSGSGIGGWVVRRSAAPPAITNTALRPNFASWGTSTIDNINNLTVTPSNPTASPNKTSTVVEPFTSAPSGTFWSIGTGVTFSGGQMTMSGTPGTVFKTLNSYDFGTDTVYINLVSATAGANSQFGLVSSNGSGGYVMTRTAAGNLTAEARAAGSFADASPTSVTYNSSTMQWLKIQQTSTNVVFSYAATQGGTYTTLATKALTDVDTGNLYIQTYNDSGTSVWDSLNTIPSGGGGGVVVNPKAVTLTDDFTGTTLNTAKWAVSGASGEITQADVLRVAAAADAPKYTTVAIYDLTASQFRLQVTPGTASGDTTTVEALSSTTSDYLRIQIKDGVVTISASSGALSTSPAILAYSGTTHRAFGFREAGGTVFVESSADGTTWTVRGQMTSPAWLSGVRFALGAFNAGSGGGGGTPPPVQATPSIPTAVTGATGDGTASINWQPPANVGTSAITGYRVTRNGNDVTQTNGAGYTADIAPDRRTFQFTGLINGTIYALSVAAVNASGVGTAASISATPAAAVVIPGAGGTPPNPGTADVTLTANLASSVQAIQPYFQGVCSSTYGQDPQTTPLQAQYERQLDARFARIPVKWNGSSITSSAGGGGISNILGLIKLYQGWGWRCLLVIAGRNTDFDGYVNGDAGSIRNNLIANGVDMSRIDFSSANEPDNAQKSAGEILQRSQQIYTDLGSSTKVWGWVAASYKRTENQQWAQGMGINRFGGVDYHHYAMGTGYISPTQAMSETGTFETEVNQTKTDLAALGLPQNVNVDEYNYSWQYVIGGHGNVTEFWTSVNTVWQASVSCHILRAGGRGMPYATQNGPLGLIKEAGNQYNDPDNRPNNTPYPAYWGVAMVTGYQTFSHFNNTVYTTTSTDGSIECFAFNNEAGGYNLVLINKKTGTNNIAQVNVSGALASGIFTQYQTRQSNPYDPPVKTGPFSYTGGSIKVSLPAMTVTTLVLAP